MQHRTLPAWRPGEFPRLGVVVPTHQRPELLARSLRSIWAQDYPGEIEVFVVLDGPHPEVPVVPEPPSGWSVSVVPNQGRAGLAGARNYGLSLVTAGLLATIDDDDEWRPHRLRSQVELMATRPGLVGAGGSTCIVQNGHSTPRIYSGAAVTHADLLRDRIAELHPSTFLLVAEVVRRIGGWDEEIPGGYAEDYEFLLRLTAHGDIAMVSPVVADIHWDGQSYFFSHWARIADGLRYLLDKHPDFASSPRGKARVLGQLAFAQAASGDRAAAWHTLREGVRLSRCEPRFLLAALVTTGLVGAERIQRTLHRFGRGM